MGLARYQDSLAQRMKRAKAGLRTSRRSIAEMAVCVGFRTQRHFTLHFRRLTDLTPTAYRQAHGIHACGQPGGCYGRVVCTVS